jgi:hypothetical protein
VIQVQINLDPQSGDDSYELAVIRIHQVKVTPDLEYGDYSVEFGVDTAEGFAVYRRAIYAFPRKRFNALALVRQALDTLYEEELNLDGDPDDPASRDHARRASDLAGRLHRALL